MPRRKASRELAKRRQCSADRIANEPLSLIDDQLVLCELAMGSLLNLSLLLAAVSWNCARASAAASPEPITIQHYLDYRARAAKDLLLEARAAAGEDRASWKHLWSRASGEASSGQPWAVKLADETFIVDEQRVSSVALNLDEAGDKARGAEHQLNLASPNQAIEFVKSYFWKGSSLLIVCQATCCTHYRALEPATLTSRQPIEYPGCRPIDASYFSHANRPHLVIAYDACDACDACDAERPPSDAVPASRLYQWNGTHMAYVGQMLVPAPKSVVAFSSGRSTILLFAIEQNPANRDAAYCLVYELNDASLLRQIASSTSIPAAISVYPYNWAEQQYFLTIDRMGVAEISLWNGTGFEKLIDLPDVQPFDQVRIVSIDGETLLFISDSNALHVYKIQDLKVVWLNDVALLEEQRVIDMTAWKYQDTILLLLVSRMSPDGSYRTELWQMDLGVERAEDEERAQVAACFRELSHALDSRAAAIKNFQIAQSTNLSNLEKSGETWSLHLADLIINEGNMSIVEFRKRQAEAKVAASPRRVMEKLLQLRGEASLLKSDLRKNTASLSADISVEGYAYIEELRVDSLEVDYVNGEPANLENYLISGIDQQFPVALSVKQVGIDDLSVSTLCGHAFEHWMQVNDSVRSSIGNLKKPSGSSIKNDTLVIESELIMDRLNTKKINGIELSDFLENVFRIGGEQAMRGEMRYEGIVQVIKLHSDKVNNVSSSDLITKPSNQSLNDVFIDTLEVEQLHVERINGVPIDKAARMSRENVIRGKVTLSSLIITDELTVSENIAIPLTHPTQSYERIHIDGDVFVKNLELEEYAALRLGGEAQRAPVRDLARDSWTRSSEQTIGAPVSLERGASVDRLDCARLNGLAESDFLYTDSAQLGDLGNVTFANFHFRGVAAEGSGAAAHGFVGLSAERVTFRGALRIARLELGRVFADTYNGIPIESIMRASGPLAFPEHARFDALRAHGQVRVGELRVGRLNRRPSARLAAALRVDAALGERELAAAGATCLGASVARLNARDLERALAEQERLLLGWGAGGGAISLTVDAEVAVRGATSARRINDEEASDHVARMRGLDPSDLMRVGSLVDLTVVENFEAGRLNGRTLGELFAASLSRSARQTIDGRLALGDAYLDYLTADAINGVDLSKLAYSDGPALFHGDVAFSNLLVDGDVGSRSLNGASASKARRRLHRLPMAGVDNLLVQGNVQWDRPSRNLRSLARLLDSAVTRHERQSLDGPIAFQGPLLAESLHLAEDSAGIRRKIAEIIGDTAVDDAHSKPIAVRGTKRFKRALIAASLRVDGNIDIERVNGLDIRRVGSQIFQRDKPELVSADITFLDNVQIGRLLTGNRIHRVPLDQLALVPKQMPDKLHFQNLTVDGDVALRKLDGLDFDDFIKRRVTTNQPNQIFADVEFSSSVRVLNGSFVESVNQVIPDNLALNSDDGAPIMLRGNKVFRANLIVEQSLETTLINDFQVGSVYDNAILNGANVDVYAGLVFEGEVQISGNMTVSGEINGLKLQRFSEIKYLQNRLALNTLSKGVSLLNDSLNETDKRTKASDATVIYLEREEKLHLHFAGIQSIKSPPAKNKTRLDIISAETSALCGLQTDCLCRKQYIVDVLPSGDYDVQEQNANNVTYTFYPAEGRYGLKIISQSTSYSERCSKTVDAHENSNVFWFEYNENEETMRRTPALVIKDYISDAQIFQIEDQLYLIVAIFYSKETKSHATNSLLYQFDIKNGNAVTVQTIPTNGAKNLYIFQIPNVGMHVLIGCVKGRAESLLLRLNPITRQFQTIHAFATGGSKHVASVSYNQKHFVILDNPDVRGLQIFNYDENYDNFVDYQNIFFESRVSSLGVFYSGDFGHSDAFVVTTTKDGWLYIYEYELYGKFQQKMSYWADGIQVLTPFRHMSENYLFAGFKFNSTVYKVIQQGYY